MLNLIKEVREGLVTAALLALVCALALNFFPITEAMRALLEKAGSLATIEMAGVKIGFDKATVSLHLDEFTYLSPHYKAEIFEKAHSLEPDEFERLMYVDTLGDLCEFSQPKTEMRRMTTIDYRLKEKGLTKIKDSPETLAKVERETAANSDVGRPRSCYVMTLTDVGRDTKTALVKTLSAAFSPRLAMK